MRNLIILLLCCGCSKELPTYPVSGVVLFSDDSPVHVGNIELKSKSHRGVHARGTIDSDGRFTLSTFEAGDGAVAGMHDCVITQLIIAEDIKHLGNSLAGRIDPRYGSYRTSGLSVEIIPKTKNEVAIRVEGMQKKQPKSVSEHGHAPIPLDQQ